MRVEKLTEKVIEKHVVTLGGKPELIVWEASGLGLRIGRKRRTWVVQYRHGGRQRRLVLGTVPHLSLPEVPTLRAFAATYLERHARPFKRSAADDEGMFEGWVLPRLGDRRMGAIWRADVAKLHSEIGAAGHPVRANGSGRRGRRRSGRRRCRSTLLRWRCSRRSRAWRRSSSSRASARGDPWGEGSTRSGTGCAPPRGSRRCGLTTSGT